MLFTVRRIAGAAVIAGGLTVLAAPASYAVVDPMVIAECLAHGATGLSGAVDPAAPGLPAEMPAVSCLAP
ncbi:hypothetical protein ACU635_21915 [[Actinomadura] parvosata]|uniref:hypothetical protein n=1 Tax=[Actinomadura] parvosata TaxID=1955412 RepID=UPI00406C6483